MKLPISNRLLACCNYVNQDDRVADVGCDHGYLSIYLLTHSIARSAIASDVNEQPLLSAVHNAEKFGVRDRMEFYLSDGIRNIPRDFTVMVCAGLGADTMISILESAPWLKNKRYRLILQCQSKTPTLRRYLFESGWRIAEESTVRDGKFLYTVMEVWWEPEYPRLTPGQWYFSPALLENAAPEVPKYYRRVRNSLRLSAAHREDAETRQALSELEALARDPNLRFLTEDET